MAEVPQSFPSAASRALQRREGTRVSPALLLASLVVWITLTAPVSAQVPEWRVSEARRVGPPLSEFASITGITLDGSGRLWIADGMAGELHVEEEGRLRRVARAGEGPGELAPGAIEIVHLSADTVVVEPHTLRLHRFTSGGGWVSTRRITGESGMTGQWHRLPGAGLAARIYPGTVGGTGSRPGGDAVREFDLEGRAGNVLARLPPTESFRMGKGPLPEVTLLAAQPLWGVDARGRVMFGSTHAYQVWAVQPDGSAEIAVNESINPTRVARELAEKAAELLRRSMLERGVPPPVAIAMVEAATVADRAPVLGRILPGPNGTLWLQEAASSGPDLWDLERPGGPTWRIHDSSGARIATATLPPGVLVMGWSGARFVGVIHDERGEAFAVVLEVDSSPGSPASFPPGAGPFPLGGAVTVPSLSY